MVELKGKYDVKKTIMKGVEQVLYVAGAGALDALIVWITPMEAVGSSNAIVFTILLSVIRMGKNWITHKDK